MADQQSHSPASSRPDPRPAVQPADTRRSLASGVLCGLGLVAFIDEAVFHQLLHWHHFYDKSTTSAGLVSDGLFHVFSWFATVAGLFMVSDLRRRDAWNPVKWWGGVLLGGGAFQLYDGTIQHKIMRIHQIRYVDNVHVYDLIWNLAAAAMILAGIRLLTARLGKGQSGKGRSGYET